MGLFGGAGDSGAADARRREEERKAAITQGNVNIDQAFSGFDQPFFNNASSNFIRAQQPDLDKQFADAKKNLTFALSRTGNLSSTAGATETRKLLDQLNRANQLVTSEADKFAQGLQGNVASTKSNLRSLLTASEDPTSIGAQAISEAERLNAAPVFAPLGQLFSGVGTSLDKAFNSQRTGFQGALGARLFSSPSSGGATTVVGG